MTDSLTHQLAAAIKPGAFSAEVDAPHFGEYVAAFVIRMNEVIGDRQLAADVVAIACERDGVGTEAKQALEQFLSTQV